ncbi:alpha-amylase [Martelella alba]|uniref:Alpha-amylase n=1 Tax=Martelella alba TaxID=2590451 RepID=A0A506UEF1_9HYPH|nr:sugar phosphorylase [Martelella alba]TPW32360.1 alpha-amylase [Martelella alba]
MTTTDTPTRTTVIPRRLREGIRLHLESIYPERDSRALTRQVLEAFWDENSAPRKRGRVAGNSMWSAENAYVITYGNSLIDGEHKPLALLHHFLTENLKGVIRGVHILPYFPYTSDDGFAITDYRVVDSGLGGWEDIERIGREFRLMSDLVLNHCSSQSPWFSEFRMGHEPYKDFFFTASPDDDLSQVVRPRAHPLLRQVETADGERYVWCTFSHDQVDFDFSNPDVLLEFFRIMRFHINRGVRTIRLDACAFMWKEVGTSCIHLPQTHEIIRLMRLLADFSEESIVLITETNVPNVENLSYFGNRNEAHMIYNFSLPPLIVHALLNGTSQFLNAWQMAMPPAQMGCAYFNFTASHDGIGLRPAESLLSDEAITGMVETVERFGGRVSMRQLSDGSVRPYEMNVSLFDALKGTIKGEDDFNIERFLCSQTIAMALEGIPAFYIHSLLATSNDITGVEKSGHNRAINRHRWNYAALEHALADETTQHARVFNAMRRLIGIRIQQPAFHPNATQFTLHLGEKLFGFWRQSVDRSQSIFAINNVSDEAIEIPAMSLNLIGGENWVDLITGETIGQGNQKISFAPYQCRWISNRI